MTTPPAPFGTDLVDPGWAEALTPVGGRVESLSATLAARPEGYLPAAEHVLRAFSRPLGQVKVLIVGQDPYPTPGHAVGLAFSVAPGVRPLPRSLANVLTELTSDVGAARPLDGDLTPWADQGVLLLNRVLTVAPGAAGSHRSLGWEEVTDLAVRSLVERGGPLVAVLWGRDAQSLRPLLGDVPVIASVHPSPLSARRGFFSSRPFSGVNTLLAERGAAPVDWSLARGGTMGR
ncbi:MAG: uracil-DNA glycosylase [Actinomycetota bacterium]